MPTTSAESSVTSVLMIGIGEPPSSPLTIAMRKSPSMMIESVCRWASSSCRSLKVIGVLTSACCSIAYASEQYGFSSEPSSPAQFCRALTQMTLLAGKQIPVSMLHAMLAHWLCSKQASHCCVYGLQIDSFGFVHAPLCVAVHSTQ